MQTSILPACAKAAAAIAAVLIWALLAAGCRGESAGVGGRDAPAPEANSVEEVSEGDTQPAPGVIYNNGEREAANGGGAPSTSEGDTNRNNGVTDGTGGETGDSEGSGSDSQSPAGKVPDQPPAAPAESPSPAPVPAPPERRFPEWIPLRLIQIAELPQPLAMAVRPGEEALYVALRDGPVLRLSAEGDSIDGTSVENIRQQTVLDISNRVVAHNELGLLGIAFSPDGERLYTSSNAPGEVSELIEWPVSGEGDISAEGRLVLSLKQPYGNHNGGDITFGPDGYLYFALGDGGGGGDPLRSGQDPRGWLGSVLRIDPRLGTGEAAGEPYGIPPDNPYANGELGAPEVWLWGVRNPWRISFDSATGDLWVSDVGQDELEEITRLPAVSVRTRSGGAGASGDEGGGGSADEGGGDSAGSAPDGYTIAGKGANLGWSAYEGSEAFWSETEPDGHVRPTHEYRHGVDGRCSITGGYVYRGERIGGLEGVYLFSDYCDGVIRGFTSEAGGVSLGLTAPDNVTSFGQGPDGEIYVMTTEALWRLEAG